ncbi:MAG TPA: uracil-DNA glycosylase [Actinomycetota bacterium]|nr:uracil-DNA glycosylase [Actinomycetota bacterium]
MTRDSLRAVAAEIESCFACPRLVAWREQAARDKPARYADDEYWARPVAGFGDAKARLLIVGLAPAAHGGNRTGRVFTGDRSGDWLFRALHKAGYANRPASVSRDDGLKLTDAYVAAVVRCAPPANKPTTGERDTCIPYLEREVRLLREMRVAVALGSFGWDGFLRVARVLGHAPARKPRFGHLAEAAVGPWTLLGSYHPSQQNTFTGTLTEEMFDAVFARARELGG